MPSRLSQSTRRLAPNSYSRNSRISATSSQNGLQSLTHRASTSLQEDVEEDEDEEAEDDDAQGGAEDEDDASDGEASLRMQKRRRMNEGSGAKSVADKLGRKEINRRAQDLIRMALFHEYKRTPLRRDDINKKVLGKENSRAFPVVYNKAQRLLRATFGYELVELRARGTESQAHLDLLRMQTQSLKEASKKRSKHIEEEEETAKNIPSGSYVLRSILPPTLLNALQTPDAGLAAATASTDAVQHGDPTGVAIDWKRAEGQQAPMGLLYLILSLILLGGRALSDGDFRAQLHRLSLEPSTILPNALCPEHAEQSASSRCSQRTSDRPTLSVFLDQLVRQGYLERVKSAAAPPGTAAGTGTSSKGRRAIASKRKDGEGRPGEVDNFEWRWGARAEVEVGEPNIAAFVKEVYLTSEDADDSEDAEPSAATRGSGRRSGANAAESRTTQRSNRDTQKEALLLRDIERAAGSQLVD
ncbi:MAGE-domain-containing protein [Ceraceosorus guamensis]|uniref:MAGE-domain-containing protein n=1 Tax=Ceraceosorus guamensis TaxID=1522189 RepID=A0A316VZ09_9BASI|nr:MAGE-domain-containing protein [Ceraceosorus guamensis]PWN42682.1 MAGE-domain-containing protein [Ceraceosorus guamensis]